MNVNYWVRLLVRQCGGSHSQNRKLIRAWTNVICTSAVRRVRYGLKLGIIIIDDPYGEAVK